MATRNHRKSAPSKTASMGVVDRLRQFMQRLGGWLMSGVVMVGVLAVVAGAIQGGLYLLDLKVERIAITGSARNVTTEEIEALVAPRLEQGFLAADLNGIRDTLEAIPWVYEANVRRRWPDEVAIHITEERPIARWGMAGFLNHEGAYFPGELTSQWHSLPRLEGPEGSEASLVQRYQNLEALLDETGLEVVWLSQDAVDQVSAELDNGVLLVLGSDHYVARVRRFVSLYQHYLIEQPVARIDMRYEHGAAVQLMPPVLTPEQSMGARATMPVTSQLAMTATNQEGRL